MDVSRLTDYAVKTCATANITTTMPRSFLIKKKNYSNCPLKKRPVHDLFIKDEKDGSGEDNSEPENLSTKPEDLSLHYPKALTPPTGVALKQAPTPTTAVTATPAPSSVIVQPTPASHFLAKSGPLEPLNLNTPTEYHHHHHHHPATAPGWHYPQPHPPHPYHLGFNYAYPPPTEFFHHHNHHLQQYSAAVRDQSRSPPPHVYSPVAVVASPKLFLPYAPSAPGLSPTSSSSSFHQPLSPEDLSSPGSVSSASSSSGGGSSGLGGGKKMRKDVTAARYQCPDCSKSYSTYSGLDKHRQHHCQASGVQAAKKSFSCKFCEKVYFSLGALKMHIRTHTLPCKCKLCGKAFSRPWLLQGHIRTHTGEKPFSCPHCSRAFADRSNLRAHLQTHSDVKKYSCSACGKTFSRMSLLSKHAESGCPASSTTSSPSPQPGVVATSMPDDRPLFH